MGGLVIVIQRRLVVSWTYLYLANQRALNFEHLKQITGDLHGYVA